MQKTNTGTYGTPLWRLGICYFCYQERKRYLFISNSLDVGGDSSCHIVMVHSLLYRANGYPGAGPRLAGIWNSPSHELGTLRQ
jgi:hypothetical protein